MSAVMTLFIDDIEVGPHHRAFHKDAVDRIAASVDQIGLQHPITVQNTGTGYRLVAGRHRLEAFRSLGKERIPATVAKMTDAEARMWEIAENLHRAELTTLERSEQISEYAELAKGKRMADKPAQVGQVSTGGRGKEGGDSAASRDLGITRQEVQRAATISAIAPEAKAAAVDAGFDDNQSKLLKIAREPSPAAQLAAVKREREIAEARKINSDTDRAIAYSEAQQFADWILARSDLQEVDRVILWLECCKPVDVIRALRREAA